MSKSPEEGHLHVDSDWKAQAEAERGRLAKQESDRAAKEPERGAGELPPADFRSLMGILASQAMSGLGVYGDEKGRVVVDPVGAKFAIDLLGVLEEKTRGNLSKEEATDMESVLRELRMRFVQVIEMLSRQGGKPAGAELGAGATVAGPSAPPPDAPKSGPRIIVP